MQISIHMSIWGIKCFLQHSLEALCSLNTHIHPLTQNWPARQMPTLLSVQRTPMHSIIHLNGQITYVHFYCANIVTYIWVRWYCMMSMCTLFPMFPMLVLMPSLYNRIWNISFVDMFHSNAALDGFFSSSLFVPLSLLWNVLFKRHSWFDLVCTYAYSNGCVVMYVCSTHISRTDCIAWQCVAHGRAAWAPTPSKQHRCARISARPVHAWAHSAVLLPVLGSWMCVLPLYHFAILLASSEYLFIHICICRYGVYYRCVYRRASESTQYVLSMERTSPLPS